jgi:hypothetical protein
MPDTKALPYRQIVAEDRFILATRDTGYRGTVAAIAELVDNAIQARAHSVRIVLTERGERIGGCWQRQVEIAVLDDGIGMDCEQLWSALQFGGSSRFADRGGLGRFGMGLPNSSVSQSRRIEVFSWQSPKATISTYLDVDEVANGQLRSIPRPSRASIPDHLRQLAGDHGTLVLWPRCDRLDFRKAGTLAEKLLHPLGRIYRRAIWQGLRLLVNGTQVEAVDPLFCHPVTGVGGATPYGTPLRYEFAGQRGRHALVEVRFTLLPVAAWAPLTIEEKRRRRIIGAGGASFLRADREIDAGWKLFGDKRRENYDDWWRCEVRFPPTLDEEFGVTHSKQGVNPSSVIRSALAPDLEAIARALNAQVRKAFMALKRMAPSKAVAVASVGDRLLPPSQLTNRVPGSLGMSYELHTAALPSSAFFRADQRAGKLVITLNTKHPFFYRVYEPLKCSSDPEARFAVEMLLLAAGRAEFDTAGKGTRGVLRQHRDAWSDALVAFLDAQ